MVYSVNTHKTKNSFMSGAQHSTLNFMSLKAYNTRIGISYNIFRSWPHLNWIDKIPLPEIHGITNLNTSGKEIPAQSLAAFKLGGQFYTRPANVGSTS
jgi:hypothetical protein